MLAVRRSRLLLLLRALLLRRPRLLRTLPLLLLLGTPAIASAWLLLAVAATRTAALTSAALLACGTLFLARLAGALLELTDLLLHEPARLVVLLRAQFVMAAVRAALPAFRVGLPAACTGDGFRQRHRKSARIVHFAAVDDSRRRTLLALIELASENSPNACWDDRRAADLLRSQTSADELRELGVEERLIEFVFPESDG